LHNPDALPPTSIEQTVEQSFDSLGSGCAYRQIEKMCAVGQFFDSTGDLSMVSLVSRYALGAIVQRDIHSLRTPEYLGHQRYLRRLFLLIRLMDGREIYPQLVVAAQST
jgi:hypothetical protein